jgi:hypothetical protein
MPARWRGSHAGGRSPRGCRRRLRRKPAGAPDPSRSSSDIAGGIGHRGRRRHIKLGRGGKRQLDGRQHWWAYISTEVFGEESQAPNVWMEVRDEAIVDDKDLPPSGPLEPIV